MSKFDELKKAAESAEPGPWTYKEDEDSYYAVSIKNNLIFGSDGYDQHPPGSNDAKFIAAANPAAILELLAILAQLVKALQQAQYAIKGREHTGFIDAALAAAGVQT